jgi:hypothetical protein
MCGSYLRVVIFCDDSKMIRRPVANLRIFHVCSLSSNLDPHFYFLRLIRLPPLVSFQNPLPDGESCFRNNMEFRGARRDQDSGLYMTFLVSE